MKEETVLFVALPYATAKLHLGRYGSTFIPADIYRRYLKKYQNKKVKILSGLDCYGTSVYIEALSKGLKPAEYVKLVQKIFIGDLKKLSVQIRYENFRTDTREHRRFVRQEFDKLLDRCKVQKEIHQFCSRCNLHLADRFLIDAKGNNYEKVYESGHVFEKPFFCIFCKKETQEELKNVLFLTYDFNLKYQDKSLSDHFNHLKIKENSKQITRYFNKWGVFSSKKVDELLNEKNTTFYVWIEALYSYMEQYRRLNCKNSKNFYYFYGKDNDYFHRIIYPQLIPHDPINPNRLNVKCFSRNFFNDLQTKEKISSSSKKQVLTLDTLKDYDSDLIRMYICLRDTLNNDSFLSKEDFIKESETFFKKTVNLVKRLVVLKRKHFKKIKLNLNYPKTLEKYHFFMQKNDLKSTLEYLYQLQKEVGNKIELLFKKQNLKFFKIKLTEIYNDVCLILELLEPLMPNISLRLLHLLKHNLDFKYDLKTLNFQVI